VRAYASSLHAWKALERQEGIRVPHGLVFSLAMVAEIGRPHGLVLDAEERHPEGPAGYDAVFISVLDSRCMIHTAERFRAWQLPLRRRDRSPSHPLVWAGGQGLHNPLPYSEIADLIVIGDAEDPLPELLLTWEVTGNNPEFLDSAAVIPGVYVPSVHDPARGTITQSVAADISASLRATVSVSLDGTRRLEIARGCKYKCAFCSLGWRAPVRENPAELVTAEIARSPKRVHLQAGDAESHSGIDLIRQALRDHGGTDQGWTGRLDTLFENPDQTIPGQKRYAFGVEGVSWRLRRAVGKGYLTGERLITDTLRFYEAVEGDRYGRAAWHMISGLPGERPEEVLELMRVIGAIDAGRRGMTRRNLAVHWQPFQPLPGTPMQWCAAGRGARRMASTLDGLRGTLKWLKFSQLAGRTDGMAGVCTVLSRSAGEPAARLLETLAHRPVTTAEAEKITGATSGPLDPDGPLPWDFIAAAHPKETLRRAYDAMLHRLAGG
jgi:radical SAM superfamily enzyme YgiQ (UPF0313 family)